LGEGLEEALRREMMEELSVRVEIGGLLGVFDRIFRDPGGEIRYHYVLVDYWGWIRSGRPKAGSDITEVRRFPLKELGALPLKEGLKETIGRAVEMRDRQRGLSDDL
jgi:ADP-ribose pyrophosphatase YjhB (NUDIX family)